MSGVARILRPPWLRGLCCVGAGLAVASFVKAVYLAGAYVAERTHSAAYVGERSDVREELLAWRMAFEADKSALGSASSAGALAVTWSQRRLGEMHAEILRQEAVAGQIIDRVADDTGDDWDRELYLLGSLPPLGGPEESPDAREDAARALVVAGSRLAAQLADRREQLGVFQELVKLERLNRRTRPEGWPVRPAYISSRFGDRIDPFTGRRAAHRGIDFAARPGTDIVAVASGIVIWAGQRDGYGKTVEIDHGNGYVTRYAHNSENVVVPGDVVTRGDLIGRVGSTGRATGPHLHFEVLRGGQAVSPLDYVEQ
jgi:hypothetical protein